MAIPALAAFAIAVLLLVWLLLKVENSSVARFLKKLPQPPTLPVIGSALELLVSPEALTQKGFFDWPRKYGQRFGVQLGPRFYFITSYCFDAEKLLSGSTNIQKGAEYKFFADWLGNSLVMASGQRWFGRRKLLTPSFHFKMLTEYLQVFNSQASVFVEILLQDGKHGAQELDICDYATRFTLDALCEAAMGKRFDIQRLKDSPYARAVRGITHLVFYRIVRPWFYPNFIWYLCKPGRTQLGYLHTLHGFTNTVMRERRKELHSQGHNETSAYTAGDVPKDSNRRPIAFLDTLLRYQAENPGELTDNEIREEIDVFMFGGHDTTATSLAWTIHLLGAHPEYQETAYKELRSIFGDDKDRPVTTDDLPHMKFLECCIKESLRLYPSFPLVGRCLTEDIILDEKTTVPKGCNFVVFLLQIHRDPSIYPQPEKFLPERFLHENSDQRPPFAFIPFSGGPRNCIGTKFAMMELKVVLATLLRNFKIVALDNREDIVLVAEIVLRPRNGLRVCVIPR